MAQVLAPILQTSASITMLHSSSDAFQSPSSSQPHQVRSSQMPRSQIYNAPSAGAAYRGASPPIAPYAFSSTPQLRQENIRTTSAPNPHTLQQTRLGHPSHPSSSSDSTVSTSGSSNRSMAGPQFAAKDDSSVSSSSDNRKPTLDLSPAATISFSTSTPDLSFSPLSLLDAPAKPSPDRYRRGARRADSSNSVTPSAATPTQHSPLIGTPTTLSAAKAILTASDLDSPTRPGHNRASSVDDMQVPHQGSLDAAKRYRRRSLSGLEASVASSEVDSSTAGTPSAKRPTQDQQRPSSRHGSRPSSSQGHERKGSAGSVSSAGSNRPSSSRHDTGSLRASANGNADAAKRVMTPSPLSHPAQPADTSSSAKKAPEPSAPRSVAVQQLTALKDNDPGRGVKSRLRRAFSFGSAAELRRATVENNLSAERARLRKDKYQTENDAEQAAIVAKQEAAGIGAGIYSGQGGFTGSNDNLSISSTASSASMMLRKMGTGMKKGGRSIKGLFRPKSVIGVPAADGPVVQASVGRVSMVTVEAERQKVNINADPHDQAGGGTGYPKLERNSLDARRTTNEVNASPSSAANDSARKSIVGGDRERAEVLSSIKKKSILKRTGTSSASSSPVDGPHGVAHSNETHKSNSPTTPSDDHAHRIQTVQSNEDYFGRPPFISNASTRSLPTTPHGSSRNISFSPRLQFHDAYSASDYDRRGDIATCNRLTPMLAQQIKEELNSFKMEMEVHELSKPHTHFF